LVLEDKGLCNYGTDPARTEQPSQDGDEMDKKNHQMAHRRMVARRGILRNHGRNNNSPATESDTIDRAGMDAEPNDPARALIHDDQDPVGPQGGRLTPEQIHTPEAVFHVAQESQPRGTTGVLAGLVVIGENPSNHVFVDLDVERQGDLLCDSRTAPVGIRCFISTTA